MIYKLNKPVVNWIIFSVLLVVNYLPTFRWMIWRYEEVNSYSSHGYLIPFISMWLVWAERKNLVLLSPNRNLWGLIIVLISLGIHLVAGIADVSSISGFSIISLIFGFIFLEHGKKVLHILWFPVAFLVFMIPLPDFIISNMNFKLKFWASDVAAWFLDLTGLPAIREGSFIMFNDYSLAIGDVCSGLRSLLALVALGVLYTWFIRRSGLKNILATLITILPAAVIGNGIRIFLVCYLVHFFGHDIVFTPFFKNYDLHLLTGMVIFLGAFSILYGANWLVDKIPVPQKGKST